MIFNNEGPLNFPNRKKRSIDLKRYLILDHEILLSKFELYGFMGASLKLSRHYLLEGTQITVINNVNFCISFIHCLIARILLKL